MIGDSLRAMPADLNPLDVDEVSRRVVDPVIKSLVRPDELEGIPVQVDAAMGDFRVALLACGEWVAPPLGWFVTDDDDHLWDAERFAAELYDRLRDELTESRLSWGELRDGEYDVLGPRGGADD